MITNLTQKTVLCRVIEQAQTPWEKTKGLMFRTSLTGGLLMDFESSGYPAIWTLGMRIPIDIIWVNSRERVVHIKTHARPWLYMGYPKKKARWVLELKSGTVAKTKTTLGDQLQLSL